MNRPLKIVYVIGSLRIGGAEKQIKSLVKEILKEGHEVNIITIAKMGRPTNLEKMDGDLENISEKRSGNHYKDFSVRILQISIFAFRFFKYLRIHKPDVVHAWLLHSYILAMPIASLARVPIRISARRGIWNGIRNPIWLYLSKLSNIFANHFTANAQAVKLDAISNEGIAPSKITVIPNMVASENRIAAVSKQPPEKVAVVANLIHYKGHLDLLEAIEISGLNLKYIFVGSGPMLDTLKNRSLELGIHSNVEFVGSLRDPIEIMLQSQFGILPSHSEGLPNVLLEAQSIGLPMIATNVGGIPELIEHPLTGYLVNPHSPTELATAISWMSQSLSLRKRISEMTRRNSGIQSPELIKSQYLLLYYQLLQNKRKKAQSED